MKRRDSVYLCLLLSPVLVAHGGRSDRKLDALSATLFRVEQTASQATTALQAYQTSCCESCADILRTDLRAAPQCLCATSTIYEPTTLTVSGAYCLANDITGNISGSGVQAVIDLKGHVVNGSVSVGEGGYVYNGTITQNLTLLSNSKAERVIVGGSLNGGAGDNILVRDSVLTNTVSSAINNVGSLVLEHCSFDSGEVGMPLFTIDYTANMVMHECMVNGDVWIDFNMPPYLETCAVYDSQILGELFVYTNNALASLYVKDSSCDTFYLEIIDTLGTPSIALHGLDCATLTIKGIDGNSHQNSRILIDECNCGNLDIRDMSNIRCQNTLVSAPDDYQYQTCSIARCHNGIFENVFASNKGLHVDNYAINVFDSSNFLFKNCYASAPGRRAYNVYAMMDGMYTSTAINFDHCVAKDSNYGFYVAGELTTGLTNKCVADGCFGGFVPNYSNVPMVFTGNLSCLNNMNYGTGEEMPPYYDITYTVTASSWRNISL